MNSNIILVSESCKKIQVEIRGLAINKLIITQIKFGWSIIHLTRSLKQVLKVQISLCVCGNQLTTSRPLNED